MKIEQLESMSIDDSNPLVQKNDHGCINPFLQEAVLMGTQVGRNVTIMHRNFERDECPYLIVIDTRTGERIKITF